MQNYPSNIASTNDVKERLTKSMLDCSEECRSAVIEFAWSLLHANDHERRAILSALGRIYCLWCGEYLPGDRYCHCQNDE